MAAMEGSDCLYGAFYLGENGPSTPEKKAGYGAEHFTVDDLLDFSNEEVDECGGLVALGDDGSARNSMDDSSGGDVTATGNSTDSSGGDVAAVDSRSRSVFYFEPHLSGGLLSRSFPDAVFSSADFCEPQIDELADLEWLSNFVEDSFSSDDFQKIHQTSASLSYASMALRMQQIDELADLECVSNFVEDSFSSDDFQKIHQTSASLSSTVFSKITAFTNATAAARVDVTSRDKDGSASAMAPQPPESVVPAKVRSKRSRAHGGWTSSKLIEPPASMTVTSSPDSELIGPRTVAAAVGGWKKTPKPKKKDPSAGAALAPAPDGRKCFHCQTDKTPQWRTGPMGPKTLCNACGVRFKSGRLVPEYRPAASPTFVATEHSNSHRKVLELRRQKEMQQQQHLFHSGGGGGGGAASLYDGPKPVSALGGDPYLITDRDYRRLSC